MRRTVVRVMQNLAFNIRSVLCLKIFPLSSTGTAPTRGFPGLRNQTTYTGRPGIHGDNTTGGPGLHTTKSEDDFPGVASPAVTPRSQPPSSGYCDCLILLCRLNYLCACLVLNNQDHLITRSHNRPTWTPSYFLSAAWRTRSSNHRRWDMISSYDVSGIISLQRSQSITSRFC